MLSRHPELVRAKHARVRKRKTTGILLNMATSF